MSILMLHISKTIKDNAPMQIQENLLAFCSKCNSHTLIYDENLEKLQTLI